MVEFPILRGLQANYESIETKNPLYIYITVDEGNIYLGDVRLGGDKLGVVVKSILFEETEQKFVINYSDGNEQVIDLVLESVLKDISYNEETKILTFTLVNGATTDISLGGLVDAYTGGSSSTANITVTNGVITADVTISAEAGNVVIGSGSGITDSGKKIVGSVSDSTDETFIPNVGAVKKLLEIGTF